MFRSCFAAAALLISPVVATAQSVATPSLPLTQNGGTWPSGHVQGIAVDVRGGYIYYSFTNLLAKYDFNGRLIGTLIGWTGHLGDLDFNPGDGKVYGSLEYRDGQGFYAAVIDASRLDRVGIDATKAEIFRTVYLPEVVNDYLTDLDGDGKLIEARDHRYGSSGFDGVAVGPAFGRSDGPRYLTVGYGIFGNPERNDNDHQVLVQYDVSDWHQYARPLDEKNLHRSGPSAVHGKYFVRTGNTTWGVQNLSYDESLQRWFIGVYQGKKPSFPNYLLFAVEARTQPKMGDLVGVPNAAGQGWEQGRLLALAHDGLKDVSTGVRGWNQKANVGFQPVGQGLFYISVSSGTKDAQTADLTLMRWTGDAQQPFVPATAQDIK